MKNVALIFGCIFLFFGRSTAQSQLLSLEFSDASFTRNVNLTFHQSLFKESFALYGGVKYLFNSNKLFLGSIVGITNGDPDERYIFYQPLSETMRERLGLKIGTEISLLKNDDRSEIIGFYDFQFSRVELMAVNGGIDAQGNLVATTFPFHPGGANIYEHYIGIGVRHKILDRVYLKLTASAGVFKLKNEIDIKWNGHDQIPTNWSFSRMFSIGCEYSLRKTK